MDKIKTSAPGKCILFGEHAVVYGEPAISMAIQLRTECVIEKITNEAEPVIKINFLNYKKSFTFNNLDGVKKDLPKEFYQVAVGLQIFADKYQVQISNIEITLNSEIWSGSGLGSSASIAVSLMGALSSYYNVNLDKETINQLSYEMEKEVHGTPSGIDNMTSTFGNLFLFQKGEMETIRNPRGFHLLIIYSGIPHNTGSAVSIVRELKNKDPNRWDEIIDKIGSIAKKARREIFFRNFKKLGHLMNENQDLLAELGLSTKEIDEIIEICSANGVYGAKLTGAGAGGCVIALADKNILIKLTDILKKRGFESILSEIDKEGLKIHE